MQYKKTATVGDADKHTADVPVILFHNGKIFSGGNDGKIKIWSIDLKLEKEIDAHPVNVYDLAAIGNLLYSCSNDDTIKIWDCNTGEFVKAIERSIDAEVLKLRHADGKLYTGDIFGNVIVYEGEKVVGQYGTLQEVTGVTAQNNYLFTTGHMDFVVTEMVPESNTKFTTRKCESGRGPICLINDNVCYIDKNGTTITVVDTKPNFKTLGKLEGHDMIVNALNGNSEKGILLSGGYDKSLKLWDLNPQKCVASVDVGDCILSITSDNDMQQIFVSSGVGNIDRFSLY